MTTFCSCSGHKHKPFVNPEMPKGWCSYRRRKLIILPLKDPMEQCRCVSTERVTNG